MRHFRTQVVPNERDHQHVIGSTCHSPGYIDEVLAAAGAFLDQAGVTARARGDT